MEFVSMSITTHVYAIVLLFLIMGFNLYNVISIDKFLDLVKRYRATTPIYHMFNAIVAYTGGIVAAFSHDLSITVILMIATSIFVMVLEIKRYKMMRVIKTTELDKQEEFRAFAKKVAIMQMSALIFTYIVSRVF